MNRFKKKIVFYLVKIDVIRRRKSFADNLLLSKAATNHPRAWMHALWYRTIVACWEHAWTGIHVHRQWSWILARIAQIILLSVASRNKTPRDHWHASGAKLTRILGNLYKSQAINAYAASEGLGRLAVKM